MGFVSASCDVSPEFREFERASTTVINAYVGPLMDRYLGELERRSPHKVSIMQSNGGLLTASEARKHAVRTILSGPAGGIVGAVEIARLCGFKKALTFDMGGTSTDVALAAREPRLTTEAPNRQLSRARADARHPHRGRGRRIDRDASMRAEVCAWGRRARERARSGLLREWRSGHASRTRMLCSDESRRDQLVGGEMRIDAAAAEAAVARIGADLGLDTVSAAAAILRVANSNMERAIRAVSVERGEDPREFPLVAFGGCGGLARLRNRRRIGNHHRDRAANGRGAFRSRDAAGRSYARLLGGGAGSLRL